MDNSLVGLRHSARGCLNCIKLCASAFDLPGSLDEQIQFLDDIIHSADTMCLLLDQLSDAHEAAGSSIPATP